MLRWFFILKTEARVKNHRFFSRSCCMDVRIVDFPETAIAVAEHHGSPALEYETARKLIAWRIAHRLSPAGPNRTFGIHYTDPEQVAPEAHRVDLAVEYALPVEPNPQGILAKRIPACRCAVVRHLGTREQVTAAGWLLREWLPQSGEQLGDFPVFFHYVNVGPQVQEAEMITDVYLPLKTRSAT